MKKGVYLFAEGSAAMRDLLGGKGAGVAEMTNIGLPVPPGFTITTEACREYYAASRRFPDQLWEQVLEALKQIEQQTGKRFGFPENPLLVSVRSGAVVSMPGMLDTVLNLGLNQNTLQGLIQLTHNERFAWDAYRRFIQMFCRIVLGIEASHFDTVFEEHKRRTGAAQDTDLSAETLRQITQDFLAIVPREAGRDFPQDPYEQLRLAIDAVFGSWMNKRAIDYRNFNRIPHETGTGVTVQTMVFGNWGMDSGTGVAFTRDPSTGEKHLYGEYLKNAQGEDVVAGTRTPSSIAQMEHDWPEVYQQFASIANRLERHYRDVQDIEFTIERGKLYILQTRSAKRTAQAAVKTAVDMVQEGLINKEEALLRVEPQQLEQLLHRRIDPKARLQVIARGLNASPGAATGKAIFNADRAESLGRRGEKVVLVRPETTPDDVHGIIMAQGILTARGGATSHAAVVARGLGKPCVSGCEAISVDEAAAQFTVNHTVVREGDVISINGSTGEVILGEVPLIEPEIGLELRTLLGWADDVRKLGVWANADYPRDAAKAREYGAEGIGLCRTEHMFMEQDRLPIVQRMILADGQEERERALAQLLPIQKEDFKGIFRVMDGLPVIIRLIDPPLHEFLPNYEELLVEVAILRERNPEDPELREKEELLRKIRAMRELNPMLGLRGCRLGLLSPGLIAMQVRAILTAAVEVQQEGITVRPEIMIPLVGHVNELRAVLEQLVPVAQAVGAETGINIPYKFGTMIEVPRGALTADEIAQEAEFFSFGTNDLTQTTFGYSRDDAEGKFLLQYIDRGILPTNPFQELDRSGVGKLMAMAVELGRKTRPDIEIGICGEHGGDPSSIEYCHQLGLKYVSCSPYRVAIARLAAAQAALRSPTTGASA